MENAECLPFWAFKCELLVAAAAIVDDDGDEDVDKDGPEWSVSINFGAFHVHSMAFGMLCDESAGAPMS